MTVGNFDDELQVILFSTDGTKRIVRGTGVKVAAVVDAIIVAAPTIQAFEMQDTPLATSATFADPQTPTSAASFDTTYPNRRYNGPEQ